MSLSFSVLNLKRQIKKQHANTQELNIDPLAAPLTKEVTPAQFSNIRSAQEELRREVDSLFSVYVDDDEEEFTGKLNDIEDAIVANREIRSRAAKRHSRTSLGRISVTPVGQSDPPAPWVLNAIIRDVA